MRWQGRRGSSNVEDRRGKSPAAIGGGIGGLGLVVMIIYLLLGGNPGDLMSALPAGDQRSQTPYVESAKERELAEFSSVVLAEAEDVWNKLFQEQGWKYEEPKLVLFTGQVESACGVAGSSTGPFYCPGDKKVYLDLSFFDQMGRQLGAKGDFAQAYVIAHEVGHHVQKQLGILDKVHAMRNKVSEKEYNRYSVMLELQADYFAGVWAHYANEAKLLEKGDLEEALNAATAIGDDRLQKMSGRAVVPDSFTHGTSEQRMKWFYKGFESGTIKGGDTFTAKDLLITTDIFPV